MFTVRQTLEFQAWLDALKDMQAQVRIAARLRLAEAGSLGDWKSVGGEVSEMRGDGGEQEAHQDGDDCDDGQQFDERKAFVFCAESGGVFHGLVLFF